MTTKVICPNCGAEIAIPEHQYTACGTVIGKDSNLGIIPLELAGGNDDVRTAINLLNVLRKAGVNLSEITGKTESVPTPKVSPATVPDDSPSVSAEEDDIERMINSDGDIPNNLLWRRFVMGHVLYAMSQKGGFTKWVHQHCYKYQWTMIIDEFESQMKLKCGWAVNAMRVREGNAEKQEISTLYRQQYYDRRLWFSGSLFVEMMKDFSTQLANMINKLPSKMCRREQRKYKRILGVDYFVDEIQEKIFSGIEYYQQVISKTLKYEDAMPVIRSFIKKYKRFLYSNYFKQSHVWENAYKGCGAFYTLLNMVKFHHCCIFNDAGEKLTLDEAEIFIREKAREYHNEGWRMVGVLKKCLDDNPQFSPEDKLREWSE